MRRTRTKTVSPYADANGLIVTYEVFGFNRLLIAIEVAEAMIGSGELIMSEPEEAHQQDLYWRDDPWFQKNRAIVVIKSCEPYMP